MLGPEKNTIRSQDCFRTGNHFRNQTANEVFYIALGRLTSALEMRSSVTGGQSNWILIPSNMSQNCVMKQLIPNAASYLPRLQALEHCQELIIPTCQMKLRKKLKSYTTRHCGPDIIIITIIIGRECDCELLQSALFIQECALDKTYKPLKKLFSGFQPLTRVKCSPLVLLTTKLFCPGPTEHASRTRQNSVKCQAMGINFRPITRN